MRNYQLNNTFESTFDIFYKAWHPFATVKPILLRFNKVFIVGRLVEYCFVMFCHGVCQSRDVPLVNLFMKLFHVGSLDEQRERA